MKQSIVLLLLMSVLFSSCIVLSFYPLYSDDTLAERPELIGTWTINGDGTWIFTRDENEPGGMILTEINYGDTSRYFAALVKLGDDYFFDLQPDLSEDAHYLSFPYPMHSFYRISFMEDNQMEVFLFDSDYLEKLFEQRKIRIKHEYDEKQGIYVLTAPTPEIQAFVRKYAHDPKAFIDPALLIKNS